LFQKRRFSGLCPRFIKALEHQRPTRQAWASGEEQKEGQQYGYIDRYRPECVMSDGSGLDRRQLRTLVVIAPGALEAEAKATPQDIRIPGSIIRYADCRSLLPAEYFGSLAFLGVKIEVGLHTAGKHIQFRLAACPERSQ